MRFNKKSQYHDIIASQKRISQKELKICLEHKTKENKDKILLGNLGLIAKIGTQRAEGVDDFDIYFSAGVEALITAIDKFCLREHSYRTFGTFAYKLISQKISVCRLSLVSPAHVSYSTFNSALNYFKSVDKLRMKLGYEPTIREIIENVGTNYESILTYHRAIEASTHRYSLNYHTEVEDGDMGELIDLLVDEDTELASEVVNRRMQFDYIHNYINSLPPMRQKIIRLKYFEEKTFDEIGLVFLITGERVRQINKEVLISMRRIMELDCM